MVRIADQDPPTRTAVEPLTEHRFEDDRYLDSVTTLMKDTFAADHRARLLKPDGLTFSLQTGRVGATKLGRFRYGTAVEIENSGPVDQINVGIVTAGSVKIIPHRGAQARKFCAGRAYVNSPGRPVKMQLSPDLDFTALFVSPHSINEHLTLLTGRSYSRAVVFKRTPCSQAPLRPIVSMLTQNLHPPGTTTVSPLVAAHLDQLLLSALLLSFPHSHSDELFWNGSALNPRTVRLVENAIRDRPEHPWTLAELAMQAGVSGRTVQLAFQRHVGMGVFDLLRQVRLRRAYDDLSSPGGEDSVASVAHRWGFTHLGRFAATYARQYFETPSHTLRRSRAT